MIYSKYIASTYIYIYIYIYIYVKYEVILCIRNTFDRKYLALALDVPLEIPSCRFLNCLLF